MPDSEKPLVLYGTPASQGIFIGRVCLLSDEPITAPPEIESSTRLEVRIEKAKQALESVEGELKKLQALQTDHEVIGILDAQLQIIRDPELWKRVEKLIVEEKRTSEFSFYKSFNEYINHFSQFGPEWIQNRVVDLQALRDKLIRQSKTSSQDQTIYSGSVVFTNDLSPAQIIELSESGIGAVVLKHGGITSHATIIAQSLGIPSVVGVDWNASQLEEARTVAIDAGKGEVVIRPDQNVRSDFRRRRDRATLERHQAMTLGRRLNQTACGTPFHLRANIEFEEELSRVRDFGAEGIGLLRTETLYLRHGYFDSNRHLQLYRTILSATGTHSVTIRLLDVGGDKFPGRNLDEPNPFLGWRGVRMLLDEEELLTGQLRTILTAASEYPGRVRILVPMVSDLEEIRLVRQQLHQIARQLESEGVNMNHEVPLGIMIEIPSIALQAERAAREADFFSIGTNDLTQYVLAADRGNERVVRNYFSGHPAVLKLIQMTWMASNRAQIPINVCGEMAGNPLLAGVLMGMGLRDLSMNPSSIPAVKQLLCRFEIKIFRELLEAIICAPDSKQAQVVMKEWRRDYLES